MDDEIDEIEELKRKLVLDVDARYGLASSEHLLSDKKHFEVWDRMFQLEMQKEKAGS